MPFAGPGKLVADVGKTLTLDEPGVIKGESGNTDPLEINGEIENDGDINILEDFTVKLSGDGLAPTSTGTITVNSASAKLQFAVADSVTNQNARLDLRDGTVDVNGALTWEGEFEMESDAEVDTEDLTDSDAASFCKGNC